MHGKGSQRGWTGQCQGSHTVSIRTSFGRVLAGIGLYARNGSLNGGVEGDNYIEHLGGTGLTRVDIREDTRAKLVPEEQGLDRLKGPGSGRWSRSIGGGGARRGRREEAEAQGGGGARRRMARGGGGARRRMARGGGWREEAEARGGGGARRRRREESGVRITPRRQPRARRSLGWPRMGLKRGSSGLKSDTLPTSEQRESSRSAFCEGLLMSLMPRYGSLVPLREGL
jgi:hypothetical protein